jgi:hypothetical protein
MMHFLLEPLQHFAAICTEQAFFGLRTWYHYLLVAHKMQANAITGRCEIVDGSFQVTDLSLVALAIVDDLLRLAAFVAIGFTMYGGFQMITSQGSPEGTKHGQQTIWNALIGLGIALAAIGGVAFLGRSIK